ncbi:LiaF transmembrane domain-containing protein [Massilia glaciei]|uniref:LiaF transmembrane domain-containing protein n=1 Tax=Massilia glaciei TaxID=1524097 RepID=UPI001E557B9C|nr:DUF5668 domain-containing protein [Massilia glaciei]
MWGLLLVGLGAAIFLHIIGYLHFWDLWHYWPLVLVVIGVNKMIGFPTARHFTSGLWTLFIGVWLFFTFEGLFGLTLKNSWPFVIIAYGIGMILEPFIKARFPENPESDHEN